MVDTRSLLPKYIQTKVKIAAILTGAISALAVAMNPVVASAATLGNTWVDGTLTATTVSAGSLQGGSLWVSGPIGTNGDFNSSGVINGQTLQTSGLWAGTGISTGGYVAAAGNISAVGTITATSGFVGALTGNVTGNTSGTSGSTTGNAATATALAANPADCAANTFATTIAASGALTCAALTDTSVPDALTIASTTEVGVTATDDGAGSFQGVWADVTFSGVGSGSYHGAMMGNVLGTNLDVSANNVFGVLGKYTVDGTNGSTEAKAGVVGEVGEGTTTANGAVVALLGGDGGSVTADAAFKVMGQNSTGGGFTYGLDLFNANTGAYLDNDQIITTDIRLQNGATISNDTNNMVDFAGATSLRLPAAGINLTDGADGCSPMGKVTYDTGGDFFGCDGSLWQQLN